jgi:hypothetical protein
VECIRLRLLLGRFPSRPEVERWRLVTWKQMRVVGQREGGRVVAEGAAEVEEVGALTEVHRGEGVAERMEAGPRGSRFAYERLEEARPQVARIERAA